MSDTLITSEDQIEPKDLFFDPESRPTSGKAKKALKTVMEMFLAAEKNHSPRTRVRKTRDADILEQQMGAILGNLVAGAIRKKPTPVAVPQSKDVLGRKSSSVVMNDKLPHVLNVMHFAGILRKVGGNHATKKLTTIEAVGAGLQFIQEAGLKRKDFKIRERAPIVLRGVKSPDEKRRQKPAKELPLPDTDEAKRLIDEVERFNKYLALQRIEYKGEREDVDDERKSTHRVFNNGSLTQGGRLYGGFWQWLSGEKEGKQDQRTDICINGEQVVGLDYGQIAIRQLYSFEGKQVPMSDAYVLEGWGKDCREGIKKLINTLINDPRGQVKAVKKLFGRDYGLKVPELTAKAVQSIYEQHSAITHHFYGKSTYRLTYEESNHLMRVLMELIEMNIPALPIHDCLYVRRSDADTVRELMKDRFIEHFKVFIEVN